ncbi:MAG: hypothetical protein Q4F25_06580 [Eubacteriales bacterium]|nr:hypothetical protein [Eubacteriales bacterium]
MNEMENNKLNDEMLENVTGGKSGRVSVRPITPKWVIVTSSSLNCRYSPDGEIAKIYERGHRLKVDGITTDGLWYRLWIYDPRGGECYGYIYKQYTRNENHEPYSYG